MSKCSQLDLMQKETKISWLSQHLTQGSRTSRRYLLRDLLQELAYMIVGLAGQT